MISSKYLILIAISGFIIAFDQVTKMYVHTHFLLGESVNVIPGYFDLTYVRNPGAAFGIFREAQDNLRNLFFLTMPPIAVMFILFILRGLPNHDKVQITALSLVCGGAIGNYIDRLRFRYVIDFLDVHIQRKYTWPAFNVADSAIVVGITILIGLMVLEWLEERKQTSASS